MAVLHVEAESRSRELIGEGAAKAALAEGEAEARVQRRKIESYGDPRLFALAEVSARLADSKQALVPERLFIGAGQRSPDANASGQPSVAPEGRACSRPSWVCSSPTAPASAWIRPCARLMRSGAPERDTAWRWRAPRRIAGTS